MAMFIFTSILMISLSAVLYLMVRALPRIAEDPLGRKARLSGPLGAFADPGKGGCGAQQFPPQVFAQGKGDRFED